MTVKFLGYCDPKVFEIVHFPRLSKATLVVKKEKEKKPKGEIPALFAFENYLTGILTSFDTSRRNNTRVVRI